MLHTFIYLSNGQSYQPLAGGMGYFSILFVGVIPVRKVDELLLTWLVALLAWCCWLRMLMCEGVNMMPCMLLIENKYIFLYFSFFSTVWLNSMCLRNVGLWLLNNVLNVPFRLGIDSFTWSCQSCQKYTEKCNAGSNQRKNLTTL